MYLWQMLHELWFLYPIFLIRTVTQTLKKIFLRFGVEITSQSSDDPTEDVSDNIILADTYNALAPDMSFLENIWYIKVKDSFKSAVEMMDDYENDIAPARLYIEVRFIEKVYVLTKGFLYKLCKKKNILF